MMTRPERAGLRPSPAGPGETGAAARRRWAVDAVIAAVVIALELLGTHAAVSWHKQAAPGLAAYLVLAAGG
ncbi:MAG: hypothetical protein ACRDPO_18800, partial [Streptosporangiaceae bacterium]